MGDEISFGEFDKDADIEKSERNLPHWFQPGTATFVTFRTEDSMPQAAIELRNRRLRLFLDAHGFDKNIELDAAVAQMADNTRQAFENYRQSCFHKVLDKGFGECLLRRPELSAIVADTLLFYNGTRYDLDRFVVMPNHVHMLVAFRKQFEMRHTLENCLHYSARNINAALGRFGSFWQAEPFDHLVRNENQFKWIQNYIKENPKKARLSKGCYRYWERST